MSKKIASKIKALFPDGVKAITITKNDYDRLYGELTYQNIVLQQENEKLKELCNKYEEEHSNEFKIWKEERHELLDYKSRCKKAIEYIRNNEWAKDYEISNCRTHLLNILQNGSDK